MPSPDALSLAYGTDWSDAPGGLGFVKRHNVIHHGNNDIPKVDYYQLFYVEALLQDSSLPQICKIKPIFEALTLDEFIDLVEKIFKSEDYELTTQFLYFLLLFRDMPHLQEYINSPKFTIENLEKLIILIFGFCSMYNHSTSRIIDEILYFLSADRLLELVLHSQYIARDKLLLFFILTKLDTTGLNKYFASLKDIADFKKYFLHLPDDILKTMISRNYQLFQYVMMLMLEGGSGGTAYAEFFNKYKSDIEQFSKLHDMIRQYKKDSIYEKDKQVPFNKRDMSRISLLVNMIKDLPDTEKAINYFSSEAVFIDDFEKQIVRAIVNNPLLKNVFQYYDSMLEIE